MIERIATAHRCTIGMANEDHLVLPKTLAEISDERVQILLSLRKSRSVVLRIVLSVSEISSATAALVPVDKSILIEELILKNIIRIGIWPSRTTVQPDDHGIVHVIPTDQQILLLTVQWHIDALVNSTSRIDCMALCRHQACCANDDQRQNEQPRYTNGTPFYHAKDR